MAAQWRVVCDKQAELKQAGTEAEAGSFLSALDCRHDVLALQSARLNYPMMIDYNKLK